MKRTLTVLRRCVVAAVAACVFGGTANAQSFVKGTFTLPYEVLWGPSVLPPGAYTISIDLDNKYSVVRSPASAIPLVLMALSVNESRKDHGTALLITRRENQRVVRSFNWREGDNDFVYTPLTQAERQLFARIDDLVAVPVLVAQK